MTEHAETTTTSYENNLWLSRFRWFFAEIIIVVIGILLALGLQSWWQEREYKARGELYQQQILADLIVTRETYKKAIVADTQLHDATLRLSEALDEKAELNREKAMQWLPWRSGWFYDPRPVLGNINSLINTGEIQYIQNPQIRASIIAHASIINGALADTEGQPDRMRRANDMELLRLEELNLPSRHGVVSAEGKRQPEQYKEFLPAYIAAWPQLQRDAQYRHVQNMRILAYENMTGYNTEILAATEKLIGILEADASQQ